MAGGHHGPDQRKRLEQRFQAIALERFRARGLDAPGSDKLGQIVHGAMAGASADELRSPDSVGSSSLGRIDQLVAGAAEADRPRNIHSAEAARLARLGEQGLAGALGHKAYAELLRARADARADSRDGGEGRAGVGSRAGDRYAGLPAVGDRVSPAVMGAYVQQYAGTGLGRGTVQTFAQVGLDRPLYNEFRKEGFSAAQVADNAKDAKALHFHGHEDLRAAQHAPTDLRKTAVKVEQAKPEQKPQAQAHEAEVARKYEALPDSDPRKAAARRFIQRLEAHGHHVELGAGATGARAKQDDAAIAKPQQDASQGAAAAQDGLMRKGKQVSAKKLAAGNQDDLGVSAAPASATPTASKAPAAPRPA